MMSKKPFDHIEDKIKEAAANSEPPYSEQAWDKMEALLEKDKRRRFLVWWRFGLPLAIIAIAVSGLLIFNTTSDKQQKKDTNSATASNQKEKNLVTADNDPGAVDTVNAKTQSETKKGTALTSTDLQKKSNSEMTKAEHDTVNASAATTFNKQTQSKNTNAIQNDKAGGGTKLTLKKSFIKSNGTDGQESVSSNENKRHKKEKISTKGSLKVSATTDYGTNDQTDSVLSKEQPVTVSTEEKSALAEEKKTNKLTDSAAVAAAKETAKVDRETEVKKLPAINSTSDKAKKKDDKKQTQRGLYFLAAGGAELIKTKLFSYDNSVVSARFGVGIGYQLNKGLSVQTGFYAGRKKYTGSGNDYHPKLGSYWSMVNLKQVDASCLVYDIPLALRYNVITKASTNFYAIAGISSFIMKKEDYNYFYTYSSMPYMIHEKPYSYTGNKNLFSVLSLSAGIERKIGPKIFVLAEPYISIPIKGVGDGAVKLYSTGLQLGIRYKPKF